MGYGVMNFCGPRYPTSRAEAKRIGAPKYFTGVPCKHGHIALRLTKGNCTECSRDEDIRNRPARQEYFSNRRALGLDKPSKRKYYESNRDLVIARANACPKERMQTYRKSWKARNVEVVRADDRHRRRKHRQATPDWLTKEHKDTIRALYVEARKLSRESEIKYVVDHIVPLRGKTVSGLHVPWNLTIIDSMTNSYKSNKLNE